MAPGGSLDSLLSWRGSCAPFAGVPISTSCMWCLHDSHVSNWRLLSFLLSVIGVSSSPGTVRAPWHHPHGVYSSFCSGVSVSVDGSFVGAALVVRGDTGFGAGSGVEGGVDLCAADVALASASFSSLRRSLSTAAASCLLECAPSRLTPSLGFALLD